MAVFQLEFGEKARDVVLHRAERETWKFDRAKFPAEHALFVNSILHLNPVADQGAVDGLELKDGPCLDAELVAAGLWNGDLPLLGNRRFHT